MKPHTSTVARILLGLLFLIFGLNGFLQFIKFPPRTGVAAQVIGALFSSREMVIILGLEMICSVLLMANRYVPLALNRLGPLIAFWNISRSSASPTEQALRSRTAWAQ